MSDVAETVAVQEPEVVEPTEEKEVEKTDAGSDDVVVVEDKVEEQNGEKVDEAPAESAETNEAEAEAEAAEEENKAENGEAKDTNGNDRKRVSSAHEEAAVVEAEEDAPSAKKSKVDDEIDVAAAGDAPAVAAE
uniref:Prothymosin alpha-like n=1 Tax=Caenorhabditis tropicalis TaxID=1561998 RepID=A0A1I7TTA7_9PELO